MSLQAKLAGLPPENGEVSSDGQHGFFLSSNSCDNGIKNLPSPASSADRSLLPPICSAVVPSVFVQFLVFGSSYGQ